MSTSRLSSIACALGLCLPAIALASTSSPHAVPAHAQAAAPETLAPTAEPAIMSQLEPKGFIDFNSYRTTGDGGAVLQALNSNNGTLDTIAVNHTGGTQITPGWNLTQGPDSTQHNAEG